MGDEPDIPADMMKMAVDLEAIADAFHPNKWVKRGRRDGLVESNGHLRVLAADCFFDGSAPNQLMVNGLDNRFEARWEGLVDGAGALVKVYSWSGTIYAPGSTVAIRWAAFR